jgi:aspartyl aminopeptidase
MTHDLTPAALLGRDDELLASARLDNLCSALAAVEALAATRSHTATVAVIALFDHEEVGSASAAGAGGPSLATALERSVLARGGDRETLHRALAGSVCLSADMAHATHPNYAERHEPGHWVTLGGGPVLKTNVNQRYATDAASAAAFVAACEQAGVPYQRYAHRNDMRCGSTIGPVTAARLGIATVDAGAPMLSMHSARELMATGDVEPYLGTVTAFLDPA